MDKNERESIIEYLVLIENVSRKVFDNMSDERLLEQVARHYD